MTQCDISCHVVHLRIYFPNFKTRQGPDHFLLCPDMENHGIKQGVLTFSHDCICGEMTVFNPHSGPLSKMTWFYGVSPFWLVCNRIIEFTLQFVLLSTDSSA